MYLSYPNKKPKLGSSKQAFSRQFFYSVSCKLETNQQNSDCPIAICLFSNKTRIAPMRAAFLFWKLRPLKIKTELLRVKYKVKFIFFPYLNLSSFWTKLSLIGENPTCQSKIPPKSSLVSCFGTLNSASEPNLNGHCFQFFEVTSLQQNTHYSAHLSPSYL